MNPFLRLNEMLSPSDSYSATVIAVDGNRVTASGGRGVTVLVNTTATVLVPGDTILVRRGSLVGKMKDPSTIPVHIV